MKRRRKMRRRIKICWKNRGNCRRSTKSRRSRRRKGRRSKNKSTREGRREGVGILGG